MISFIVSISKTEFLMKKPISYLIFCLRIVGIMYRLIYVVYLYSVFFLEFLFLEVVKQNL